MNDDEKKKKLFSRMFSSLGNNARGQLQPSEIEKQSQDKILPHLNISEDGKAKIKPIGAEQIREANLVLMKYKSGKENLDERIVANEQWYKLHHWEMMDGKKKTIEPRSAWLFNVIANKHADAMDNFPSPNILPREMSDKSEATMLSSIVPVILDQAEFERTYSDVWNYKLKSGTGCYGVFWDKNKLNGLGDISIKKIDLLNLFWEPGITDIQKSRNVFHIELRDNDLLVKEYSELDGKLGGTDDKTRKYIYEDTVDTSNKSAVIDWYYKTMRGGKTILHYCKYVNDTVLYATENEDDLAERGLYDHGRYPFEFDVLYPVEGSPAGFGIIDIGKNAQEFIDRGNQAILENMLSNARPRYFVKEDGGVNEKEYADMTKTFVHVEGSLNEDNIVPIVGKPLNGIYVSVVNNKIEELKEVTGNRDISTGGTSGGATAASAIAALQESGSKLSRDAIKSSYRCFKNICTTVIELIRQFYTLPRCFRIVGEDGAMQFQSYNNKGLQPIVSTSFDGEAKLSRLPIFDIEVTAQKSSPYSKMAQNELALQFFGAGFFNPQIADQALACVEMMDFDRKEFILQKISQNGTMYQKLMMMQQQMMQLGAIIDSLRGTNEITSALASQFGLQSPGVAGGKVADASETKILGGDDGESKHTKKARQRVADSTSPT